MKSGMKHSYMLKGGIQHWDAIFGSSPESLITFCNSIVFQKLQLGTTDYHLNKLKQLHYFLTLP